MANIHTKSATWLAAIILALSVVALAIGTLNAGIHATAEQRTAVAEPLLWSQQTAVHEVNKTTHVQP